MWTWTENDDNGGGGGGGSGGGGGGSRGDDGGGGGLELCAVLTGHYAPVHLVVVCQVR